MLSTSSLRGTAILAAALTLAACGSDKAAGPTTANNQQIISDMMAAYQAAPDTAPGDQLLALQFAIVSLSAGAPVNPGSVTIGGRSYPFSTTSMTLEFRDVASGDVTERATIVTGWRHTNGDSMFVAAYAPDGEIVFNRTAASTLLNRSSGRTLGMASLSAMVRSGNFTVSREATLGPDVAQFLAFIAGDGYWGADFDDGIVSGSLSSSQVSGECDLAAAGDVGVDTDGATCELQKSNVSMQANTWDARWNEEEGTPPAGPAFTIPAQAVTGVKFVIVDSSSVQ